MPLDVLLIDLDETLLRTSILYADAIERWERLLTTAGYAGDLRAAFYDVHLPRVALLGHTRDVFPTSLALAYDALCVASGQDGTPDVRAAALALGESVYTRRAVLVPYARDLLTALSGRVRLWCYTMGDPEIQARRLLQADLDHFFEKVAIVPTKHAFGLRTLLASASLDPARVLVLGDSLRYDMWPAQEVGCARILLQGARQTLPDTVAQTLHYAAVWTLQEATERILALLEGAHA